MWGEETPGRIALKFCVVIGTQDVITCVKFGDDRLRGLWWAGCQNLPFPIDFDGRPYNSECYATACTVIIDPYVYRLYWYLEAYNVTSAIAFGNTAVVEWTSACPLLSRAAGFKSRHNWASKFLSLDIELQDVNSL